MKDFCQASRNKFEISAHKQDWRIVISCNNGKAIATLQMQLDAQSLVLSISAKNF